MIHQKYARFSRYAIDLGGRNWKQCYSFNCFYSFSVRIGTTNTYLEVTAYLNVHVIFIRRTVLWFILYVEHCIQNKATATAVISFLRMSNNGELKEI